MNIQNRNKLKTLLNKWPQGSIATSQWLRSLGISRQLVQSYIQAGWIKSLGPGAYQRADLEVTWYKALMGLQKQMKLSVHIGGPTAIFLRGASHYLRPSDKDSVFLFSSPRVSLPKWFYRYPWKQSIEHIKTSFLPPKLATSADNYQNTKIILSSLERAIMECLYISPNKFEILECYQILEGLRLLRPNALQKVLINCHSIKVKRLFLYMAEKAQLSVLKKLKLESISLGSGDRSIVKNGVYDSKYKISIPRELINYE